MKYSAQTKTLTNILSAPLSDYNSDHNGHSVASIVAYGLLGLAVILSATAINSVGNLAKASYAASTQSIQIVTVTPKTLVLAQPAPATLTLASAAPESLQIQPLGAVNQLQSASSSNSLQPAATAYQAGNNGVQLTTSNPQITITRQ